MSKRKVSRFIVLILICCIACVICGIYFFEGQLKEIIKERVSAKVYKERSVLEELVAEIGERNVSQNKNKEDLDIIVYKDIDNFLFAKVFNEFHLSLISNELHRLEDQHVTFVIFSFAGLVWEGYSYGFYYSCSDEPIDVVYTGKKCEPKFEDEMGFYGSYSYKTNRIVENWWYYEWTISTNSSYR